MTNQPQTVTIAQARLSGASGLLVLDNAANIAAALPNPALVARVASFTVSGPALLTTTQLSALATLGAKLHAAAQTLQLTGTCTLNVAQLTGFETLPGFTVAPSGNIHLTDTTSQIVGLLASHSAWFAQISTVTVQLDGSSMGAYPATQLNGLIMHGKTVVFVPSPAHPTLNINAAAHDLATNAASLNALAAHQALSFSVTNDGTAVSASDAVSLLTLQGFSPAAHTLTVTDTGANLSPRVGTLLGQGFGQILVSSGTLSATSNQLLSAGLHFAVGSHAQLSASVTVNGTTAASLVGLPTFTTAAGAILSVADTADNLLATSASWLSRAGAASLTASAILTAQAAGSVGQIATALNGNFSLAGHSLSVVDTLTALTMLNGQAAGLATSLQLSADATVGVTQFFLQFRGLPNVSLAGHLVTVSDTASNLLTLAGGTDLVHATALSVDANVNAAQLLVLSRLPGFSSAGHALAVTDTAANLLALPNSALLQVTATSLSADASLTAQQARTLFAEPGFTSGGHQLAIADTAGNLLGLAHNLQVAATILSLSGSQTVTASELAQLTGLGIKFSQNGYTLTCVDTAANLAHLTPAEMTLASAEVLGASATVSAATAASLSGLANFSLAAGMSLTIQDSATNLIALGQNIPSLASLETLPAGSMATVSAAQAIALAALPHFSSTGAQITVADSVANLAAAGSPVLTAVGTNIEAIDTAANIAAAASTPLVQTAGLVTLSGNAQITAAMAAQIGAIPYFSLGSFQLTVVDTAAHIASDTTAISRIGAHAVVADSGPIDTRAADALANLSTSGMLTFQGGNQLLVQDSYSALTASMNSPGLVLASRIGIIDTATNLVSAAMHDWGALSPSYTLSQSSVVSAAVVSSLASLGSHYSTGNSALTVTDTAGNVVSAGNALSALSITASVYDTASNVIASEAAIHALGRAVASINIIDLNPVSADTAAMLSGVASLLTGPAVRVSADTAGVEANLAALTTLQSHVAVTLTDSAANVGAAADDLGTLGSRLSITLLDNTPISATVAANLLPVLSQLVDGTGIAVSDLAANIVAQATSLAEILPVVGQINLSDGSTLSAATAAALTPFDAHLAPGLKLTVLDSATSVGANLQALARLNSDGRLNVVSILGSSASDVASHLAALNAVPAQVSITDSASNVSATLAALIQVTGLQTISLTDGGTPAFTMTLNTIAAAAPLLAKIVTPYTITLSDTAANIAADLSSTDASVIAAHLNQIGQITASNGRSISLAQNVLFSPGVDDGVNSALAKFDGHLNATGLDIVHLSQLGLLEKTPDTIAVVDSSLNISADLSGANSSIIIHALHNLTSVTSTDGNLITLTAGAALQAGVDDSLSSVATILVGANFAVTDAAVADLPALMALLIPPISISVADTAAAISADLLSPESQLVANRSGIGRITITDGQPLLISESTLLESNIDDGVGSVLSKVLNDHVTATGVAAADVVTLLDLSVPPEQIAIVDSAANIESNLQNELSHIEHITSISVDNGMLTFTAAQILSPHVDDGPNSLIARLSGRVFNVTDASVVEVPTVMQLNIAPDQIWVLDSSSNIIADLTAPSSALAANISGIAMLAVVGGTITLTAAQAHSILSDPLLSSVLGRLDPATQVHVAGVSLVDMPLIASSGWPNLAVSISDSALNIAADLNLSNGVLAAYRPMISNVNLTEGGTVDAVTLAGLALLPHFQSSGEALSLQGTAADILHLSQAALSLAQSISIVDTSENVSANFDALHALAEKPLAIALTDSAPAFTITTSQYHANHGVLDAITTPATVTVMGDAMSVSEASQIISLDSRVARVVVSDSAINVISNLGALIDLGTKLSVTLTDTSIPANLVLPLLAIPSLDLQGLPVLDTGTQIASVIESGDASAIAYLSTYGASLSDNTPVSAADAVALQGLSGFNKNGHLLIVWDTASHLTTAAYNPVLSSGSIDSIFLKTAGGSVTITAAAALTLFSLPGFSTTAANGTPNALLVSDTADHLDAALGVLLQNRAAISAIVVNSSAVVSDQVLVHLQSIGATTANGAVIVVRDTASIIAASALSQLSGHTIEPMAWGLSGNAIVDESTALTLASFPQFSTNGYMLTLQLASDITISVGEANQLASIAGSLNLNGHHLIVAGSAQQLSALTANALQIVTPALVDSIPNIVGLSQQSAFLKGTVEVTGGESLTATETSSFLRLVDQAGLGLSPGQLTFDAPHLIVDTVANLRTLVASSAWAGQVAEQLNLGLIAQDTLSELTNPNNTAFLRGVTASTLQGNTTVGAAAAAALVADTAAIHFSANNFSITVQDTVSNLTNPAYLSGLASANLVQLSGPDQADVADAERLLSLSNFRLTTQLTVADSSTNLLDGRLASIIQASGTSPHIQLQLAGPEVLDAQTAASLVALPGFSDPQHLTISDDPSYLLNPASLPAEQVAAQVTLAGDEVVSANTILRLSELPHFSPGGFHLILSGSDFADARTLTAIANLGAAFNPNGHTLAMTSDALALSPSQFANLHSDGILQNGHQLGFIPNSVSASDSNNILTLSGSGVVGSVVNVYGADGSLVASQSQSSTNFSVPVSDVGAGRNFSVTEAAPGTGNEGAPLIILDTAALEAIVAAAGSSFASLGAIQVDAGKFLNIYNAGSVPNVVQPALVYDATSHTISLDLPSEPSLTLLTLGSSSHPSSLASNEIIFKTHG